MKRAIIIIITFILMVTACDNSATSFQGSPAGNNNNSDSNGDTYVPYSIAYSAEGPDISQFLNWEWAKDGTDFVWLFQTDGTVSVIHCCGELYKKQFNYLFEGNVLITYGHETSFDEIVATGFTVADDGLSFTRDNGQRFTRRNEQEGASSDLVLSNALLGKWQGEDGTEYVFGSDSGLLINSGQYGYFVRYAELLTLGALVDGTQVVLQKYKFNRAGNKLYLRGSDGQKYTLNLSE